VLLMNVIGSFFINEICAPNKLKLLFDKTPIVVLLKLSQIKCGLLVVKVLTTMKGNLLKLYLLMVDGRLAVVGVATKNFYAITAEVGCERV
jgi:hypothetical protein